MLYLNILNNSDIDNQDSKYLLCGAIGCELVDLPKYLYLESDKKVLNRYKKYVEDRKNGQPVDLILGNRGFWKGIFKVTKDVLSPRPDTELIIESALKYKSKVSNILDLGTGTGCILINLLIEYVTANGLGVDISDKALSVSIENAKLNGVEDRVFFKNSNWFDSVTGTYDMIVSNPPYILSKDIPKLSVEVKKYDPLLALDGGVDGLDSYRIIARNIKQYLTDDALIIIEFGINQEDSIIDIFSNAGLKNILVVKDLSGIYRVAVFKNTR